MPDRPLFRRAYLDANVWISAVSKEAGRVEAVYALFAGADQRRYELATSTLTLLEVLPNAVTGNDEAVDILRRLSRGS